MKRIELLPVNEPVAKLHCTTSPRTKNVGSVEAIEAARARQAIFNAAANNGGESTVATVYH